MFSVAFDYKSLCQKWDLMQNHPLHFTVFFPTLIFTVVVIILCLVLKPLIEKGNKKHCTYLAYTMRFTYMQNACGFSSLTFFFWGGGGREGVFFYVVQHVFGVFQTASKT